ncbi:hypothetical protein HKX48_009374 [Thoreauomyces humboldtii]|nr:hypothetical protein HKX48_009374 [Thoreauomyces humboldtii]
MAAVSAPPFHIRIGSRSAGGSGSRTPTGIPLADAQLLLDTFSSPESRNGPRSPGELADWTDADEDILGAATVLFATKFLYSRKAQQFTVQRPTQESGTRLPSAALLAHHIPATAEQDACQLEEQDFSRHFLATMRARMPQVANQLRGFPVDQEDLGNRLLLVVGGDNPAERDVEMTDASDDSSDDDQESTATVKPNVDDMDSDEPCSSSSDDSESEGDASLSGEYAETSGAATPVNKAQQNWHPSPYSSPREHATPDEIFRRKMLQRPPGSRPFRLSRLKRTRYDDSDEEQEDRDPVHREGSMHRLVVRIPPSSSGKKRQREVSPEFVDRSAALHLPSPSKRARKQQAPSSSSPPHRPNTPPQSSSPGSPHSQSAHLPAPSRRKTAKMSSVARQCGYCQATETPMWRHGPTGYADLCNKCGVKWMRGRILQTPLPQTLPI